MRFGAAARHRDAHEPAAYSITKGQVVQLAIREILPDPCGAHRVWALDELARLAESIAVNGVEHPIVVRYIGGIYQLVSGERRLRAAAMAGFTHVPCMVEEICGTENDTSPYGHGQAGARAYFAQLADMTDKLAVSTPPENAPSAPSDDELAPYPLPRKTSPIIRDVRLLVNTVQRACRALRDSGVHTTLEQTETADELCLTVRVAKADAR